MILYICQKEMKDTITQNLCSAPSKKVKKILKNLLTNNQKYAIINVSNGDTKETNKKV